MAHVQTTTTKMYKPSALSDTIDPQKMFIDNINKFEQIMANRGTDVVIAGTLVGDDSTDNHTLLEVLLTAIGSTETDLLFPRGIYRISDDVTFPDSVHLHFAFGAILKPANGKIITGTNTRLMAGLYQILDLSLGGSVGGTWNIMKVVPQWFGSIGDGDDKTTIEYMLAFANMTKSRIVFPNNTYTLVNDDEVSYITFANENVIDLDGSTIKLSHEFNTGNTLKVTSNDTSLINGIVDGDFTPEGNGGWVHNIVFDGCENNSMINIISMKASNRGTSFNNCIKPYVNSCKFIDNGDYTYVVPEPDDSQTARGHGLIYGFCTNPVTENSEFTRNAQAGIQQWFSDTNSSFNISRCEFIDNGYYGVVSEASDQLNIKSCNFYDTGTYAHNRSVEINGLAFHGTKNASIEDCKFIDLVSNDIVSVLNTYNAVTYPREKIYIKNCRGGLLYLGNLAGSTDYTHTEVTIDSVKMDTLKIDYGININANILNSNIDTLLSLHEAGNGVSCNFNVSNTVTDELKLSNQTGDLNKWFCSLDNVKYNTMTKVYTHGHHLEDRTYIIGDVHEVNAQSYPFIDGQYTSIAWDTDESAAALDFGGGNNILSITLEPGVYYINILCKKGTGSTLIINTNYFITLPDDYEYKSKIINVTTTSALTFRIATVTGVACYIKDMKLFKLNAGLDTRESLLYGDRLYAIYTALGGVGDLSNSATFNPGVLVPGQQESTTIAVTGAVVGDFVVASFSNVLSGVQLFAEVTAAGIVTIRFTNMSGADIDLASGTLKVKVIKP